MRDDVQQVWRLAPVFIFDVSLRIGEMESFAREVREALLSCWPTAALMIFGHMGDGNLHLIALVGDGGDEARKIVEGIIYGALQTRGGSISAEHGIGLEKRAYLSCSRNPEEIALMRALKRSLDPRNILNPGKIFPNDAGELVDDHR